MNELTGDAWLALCRETTTAMREHVVKFVTPIGQVTDSEPGPSPGTTVFTEGRLLGTGSYFEYQSKVFALTNEHVARHLPNAPFTHQFHDAEDVYLFRNDFVTIGFPTDAAFSPVDATWRAKAHPAAAIPISRFADKHAPEVGECIFFYGYSGERSKFVLNTLASRGTPYLTQEPLPCPEGLHPHQFSLFYLPDKAESVDGKIHGLPDAYGLSGTLVWNTRRVECLTRGMPWTPECAVVTGLLNRWDQDNGCVSATRIEHVLNFIHAHARA